MQSVAQMEHGEALELLLRSARLDRSGIHNDQASAIVTELGFLALAIDQAGAYIASGECTINDFLETFNVQRENLLQNEAYKGASDKERAVYATWDLSHTAIARRADLPHDEALRQGPKAALQILHVFPFFHNEGIMEDIFKFAAENSNTKFETDDSDSMSDTQHETNHTLQSDDLSLVRSTTGSSAQSDLGTEENDDGLSILLSLRPDRSWDSIPFRRGVQTLLSFSLIRRDKSQREFVMHPLVHFWAYDRLTVSGKKRFGMRAQFLVGSSVPWKREAQDFTFRRNLLPHVSALQRKTGLTTVTSNAEDWEQFAIILFESGRFKEAEELFARVEKRRRKIFGEGHLDTLRSLHRVALTYSDMGRLQEAKDLGVQLVQARKRVLGNEHPDTLDSMHVLAATYRGLECFEEAEGLGLQVAEVQKRLLGEEHADTLGTINNLAKLYRCQGRFQEAQELALEVVEVRKRVRGNEHPDTLSSMDTLAAIYAQQGRFKEAEDLSLWVIEAQKRVQGEDHPYAIVAMRNLAYNYKSQGRNEEAISQIGQVLELYKRVLGPDHFDTEDARHLFETWRKDQAVSSTE